ncbi:MAG: type II secretion system protein [Gemmatimonadaceae bacterium]
MLSRRATTLVEVIVTVAILGVIGGAVYLNQSAASALGGDAANVDQAARILAELADAAGRITGTGGETSFNQVIGQSSGATTANIGLLSQLTTKLTTASQDSCFYGYSGGERNRWLTPFYYRPLPTTGLKIAPGYIAIDSVVRYNSPGVPTTLANRPSNNDNFVEGTSAIVMPNTALSDAVALAARVEGDQGGVLGAVRYFPMDGSSPVQLEYHFTVRGC